MAYQRVMLKAVGGPECLELVSEPCLPEPGPGEVRVRVLAAGTGFTDTIIRRGNYPQVKDKPPFTPGYDLVGEVDAIGPGVTGLHVGDRVADMPVIGSYTQYAIRPAQSLVPVPADVDPAEAVCMPLSYLTAYQMLKRIHPFSAGQRILVIGASGAVGTALLELGKLMGLEVYGTCSGHKRAFVESLGAVAIDYRTEDFEARIKALTGDGVDAVFDAIGGEHWDRSYRCLRKGGWLIGYGAQNIAKNEESVPRVIWGFFKLMLGWKLLPDGKHTAFYNIQTRRDKFPIEFKEDLQALFALLRQGRIKPVVAGRLPLREVGFAHQRIDAGEVCGKLVLLPFAD